MTIDALYRDHHGAVEALARRITRDEAAGEDVAARTFEELPHALRSFQGTSEPRSFVLGVCANLARRFRRSDARRQAMLERLAVEPARSRDDDPESQVARRELLAHVLKALETLPPEQRNAFLLASVEDCSAAEIAAASGVPEATVRTRIFHARKKLRDAIEKSTRSKHAGLVPTLLVIALVVLAATGTAMAAPRFVRWMRAAVTHVVPMRGSIGAPRALRSVQAVRTTPLVATRANHIDGTPAAAPIRDESAPTTLSIRAVETHLATRSTDAQIHAHTRPLAPPEQLEPLYLEAHRAHFDERDYARAVAAWDAYLAQSPRGRLSPEARYNRALALMHLRRFDEARAALTPFAEGLENGYRRDEATRLLTLVPTAR